MCFLLPAVVSALQEVERDAAVAAWRRLTASSHVKQQQLDAASSPAAAATASGDTADADEDLQHLKVGCSKG